MGDTTLRSALGSVAVADSDRRLVRQLGLGTLLPLVLFLLSPSFSVDSELDVGPTAHWSFGEGSGSMANDATGNGNTGTLVNDPAYVDGVLAGSDTAVSADSIADTADLRPGRGAGDYDGLLDEVRFYNRVPTPQEVADLFNAALDATPPSTPTGLATTSVSSLQVDLMWNASADPESGIAEYVVYRGGVEVGRSAVTTFSDASVAQSTIYSYEVSAVNGDGLESSRSAPLSVTTPADITPPFPVWWFASETTLRIAFNETLDDASAADISSYSIDNGVSVTGASLASNMRTVTLMTSTHAQGIDYTVTITGVRDGAGNAMGARAVGYEMESSLAAYWTFDEGAGTTAGDSSGNGNTGSLINSPSWVNGKFGKALDYVAAQQQSVSVADAPSLNLGSASFSVAFWLRYTNSIDADIIRKGSGSTANAWFKVEILKSTQKLFFNVHGSSDKNNITAPDASNDGLWHHVVAVRDVENGRIRLYIDGTQVVSSSNPGGSLSNSADLSIGSKDTLADDFLNGSLDDVLIFSRALSAAEVLDLFNSGN